MMMGCRKISALACVFLAAPAWAQLDLTLEGITDISGLGFDSVGGAAFDPADGRLWVSEAGGSQNLVAEIDPDTGEVFSSFNASVVPGLVFGPDAVALEPVTGDLVLYGSFGDVAAGRVTQGGALVSDFGSTNAAAANAGGAAFSPAGVLYVVDEGNGSLRTVDPLTGAVLTSTPISGFNDRLAAAEFDPFTGNLFVYDDTEMDLLEIDVVTATVLSTTDLSTELVAGLFPTGFAFNADGSRLFIVSGSGVGGDQLFRFTRVIPEPATAALVGMGGLCLLRSRRSRG